ncbi:Short chain dehydrogenase-like protein 1 [Elsinoe fawcettii]|nr:Short chain dehydrogenase-like protein 1 [Elsinoe fawcettii]
MALPFAGRIVTVTGAASGIGRATANILYAKGAHLALSDINAEALEEVKRELATTTSNASQAISTQALDIADAPEASKWISTIISNHGKLDHAAIVAGVNGQAGKLTELSDDDFRRCVDVNLFGVFYCLREQLNLMQRGGSIATSAL